ncbi:MAG: sigma-70 family RNA polymerase sigma factor [Agriterribacter sp.]
MNLAMEQTKQHNIVSIVRDYGGKLFNFIRGKVNSNEDAEDILQDVWYQVSNMVNIDEINSMSGWLFRVARNRVTDKYRKKKDYLLDDFTYDEEEGLDFKSMFSAESDSPEMKQFKSLFWEELMEALDELPENQKQVFIWNELEDMTLQEIADKTNEKLKTIISRKGYAVKHLRVRLADLYNELNNL